MRWWRVFISKLSGAGGDEAPAGVEGPRRRQDERFGFVIKLQAKCSSWPGFIDLFSGDVSSGGLFIPTDQPAAENEHLEVELHLPDGGTFSVGGTVVNIVDAQRAAELNREAGLGIRLDPLEGEAKQRFEKLLLAAKSQQPVPEPIDESAFTKTGSVKLSAVHAAMDADEMGDPPHRAKAPRTTGSGPRHVPAATSSGPIVGIDMGTTYTSIAAVQGKKVTILQNENGSKSTPSVVSFLENGEFLVGDEARARIATDPAHTIASPKRLLGRPFEDREVQTFLNRVPYRTLAGPDGTTVIEQWGQQYAIPQVCSKLLAHVKAVAESQLGVPITRAVTTVPISFDDDRVKAMRRAGEIVGLEIVAVIDEPSSAALANRFDPHFGGTVAVYDFGGGTFDFSVVEVGKGDFRVLSTSGDTWLGGDDFDQALAEAAANQFWRLHKVDLRNQAVEWQRLLFACESAKRELSKQDKAVISVPEVLRTADGMIDLELSLDRATFRRATAAIVQRSLDSCSQALALLDMKPSDLTTVYLSGGTTYIPAVREALAEYFGVPIRTGVPPEHAVCLGAAIHAAQLQYRGAATLAHRG